MLRLSHRGTLELDIIRGKGAVTASRGRHHSQGAHASSGTQFRWFGPSGFSRGKRGSGGSRVHGPEEQQDGGKIVPSKPHPCYRGQRPLTPFSPVGGTLRDRLRSRSHASKSGFAVFKRAGKEPAIVFVESCTANFSANANPYLVSFPASRVGAHCVRSGKWMCKQASSLFRTMASAACWLVVDMLRPSGPWLKQLSSLLGPQQQPPIW